MRNITGVRDLGVVCDSEFHLVEVILRELRPEH